MAQKGLMRNVAMKWRSSSHCWTALCTCQSHLQTLSRLLPLTSNPHLMDFLLEDCRRE